MSLVDRLRGDELGSLTSEVAAGRREHILKSLDERGGAQELVRQQYSGRYPFELLQNANDAAVDIGRPGRVRFVLTDSALIVADNGAGFGEAQVKAICGLGRSSKDPRKSIGYKGLGFKSVGEITSRPQIFSNGTFFEFNEGRVREVVQQVTGSLSGKQRLPVYAFPFPVQLEDVGPDGGEVAEALSDGFSTVFRLPLRPDADREQVETHLVHTLVPRLLLFLSAIEEIELRGTSQDFRANVTREGNELGDEVLLESAGEIENWLVYRQACDVDRSVVAPLGDAWAVVEQVYVAIAVALGDDGRPSSHDCYPVHVYFPTEERTALPVIVQADFALQLDRRGLATTPESVPYNSLLLDAVARLLGEVVAPDLARRWPGDVAPVAVLTPRGAGTGLGAECLKRCVEALRGARFLPAIDGRPRMAAEAVLLPEAIPDTELAQRFLNLVDLPRLLVSSLEGDAVVRTFLVDKLAVSQLLVDDVLNLLVVPEPDQRSEYYEMLVAWAETFGQRRFASALAELPCVVTTAGAWVRPSERVFFSRRRDDVEIPADIPVPIAALPDVDGLESLLRAAGVRDFEWRELLSDFLLPILTDHATSSDLRKRALNGLRSYYLSQRTGDPRLQRRILDVLLPARPAGGSEVQMCAAGRIYFPANWSGSEALERLYGPFGETEFLALPPPDDAGRREEEKEFLAWIGVASVPRVLAVRAEQRDDYHTNNLTRHSHRMLGEWWDGWWRSEEITAARVCSQGHDSKQQLEVSFALDRFADLASASDPERMLILWNEIGAHWGAVYEPSTRASFVCRHGFHTATGPSQRSGISVFGFMLAELAWVPARRNTEVVFVRPSEAWRLAPDTPKWVAKRVPVLESSMANGFGGVLAVALGTTDAARPSPKDLCDLLAALRSEYEGDGEHTREIYVASRWAMRALNDAISEDCSALAGMVWLFARYRGEPVFHTDPVVALDPLLAETWEEEYPILDADRDLRRLHESLGLRLLDDPDTGVKVRPVSRGPREDLRPQIEAQLNRCKPFLAAVAIQGAPSREEEVLRGLVRLEISVCDELALEYTFEGKTKERHEAVSYLAVRREAGRGSIRRNIATAHLEIDPSTFQPDWYAFGPQLAQFLNVPTMGDAFAVLLMGEDHERAKYIASRRVSLDAVRLMQLALDVPPTDEVIDDVFDFLTTTTTNMPGSSKIDAQLEPPSADDDELSQTLTLQIENPRQLPDLNPEGITMADVEAGAVRSAGNGSSSRGTLGPSGVVDHVALDRQAREVGRRGEQAAMVAEKERVAGFGGDPSAVVWRSERNPLAPFDIESLDEDGQRIYIEVKSTTGTDPSDPFIISYAELHQALKHRSRFYIYRVTSADTSAPRVHRYQDPARLLVDGRAVLRLSDARMVLGSSN